MTGSSTKQAGAPRWSALQRWTLGVTSMAAFMAGMDALVVTTALPTIHADLGAATSALSWTVVAYALGFAAVVLAGVALGDRFGRRGVFLTGLALFTVGSAGCALSPNVGLLIATRAIQGIGGGLAVPLSLVLISEVFPPQQRARAIGIWGAITGMAVAVAPLVGGAIVSGLAWRWIFWVNVPIAAVLIPLVLVRLEKDAGSPRRLDYAGIGLVSAAAFGLVWGLIRGNASGWASAEVVAALSGGAIALVVFVGWELRADAPLIPMRFFASRAFSAGNAAAFLLFACTFSGAFFFAQFLQVVLRHGPMATGLLLTPWTASLFVVAPIAGKQVNRIGARPLVTGGLLLQAAGFGWIALIAGPGLSYPALILPFVISGVGISMTIPAAQSAVIGAVPTAAIGAASGTFNTVRQLGGAFGIAITTAVFTADGGLGSATAFSDGFTAAIATAAALAFAGAVIGLLLPQRAARSTGHAVPVPTARAAR